MIRQIYNASLIYLNIEASGIAIHSSIAAILVIFAITLELLRSL